MTWLCKVFIPVCLISIWCQLSFWTMALNTLQLWESSRSLHIGNPCRTAIHRWKVINGVISSEENGALEVRLLQRDHPWTVQAAAALERLHSATVLRFLGNNIYVLVPKLLPVFSHLSQPQTKLPQDFKISNKSYAKLKALPWIPTWQGDIRITKVVFSGRGSTIAFWVCWSLQFPQMWENQLNNLW